LKYRIFALLVLLSAGFYALTRLNDVQAESIQPTLQPSRTASITATKAEKICTVQTGIDSGRVNLRQCEGLACPVLLVLHEGQALSVIHVGAWSQVETKDGVRGWINSNYCK
jgi:SH3-like domain-containing protein